MDYEKLNQKEANERIKDFPVLDVPLCEEQANSLYKPYLFFHKTRNGYTELWSSCCRKSGNMENPPRTVTDRERSIIYGKHNETAICPYCGRSVTLKSVSRLGGKKNLEEYHPIVFLAERGGELYAQAFWTRKNYKGDLTEPPKFHLMSAYHFKQGQAVQYEQNWWPKVNVKCLEKNYDPVHRVITEPFTSGGYVFFHYESYVVFGLESISRSVFRYCQYEHYEESEKKQDLMKYMAACCLYPRQIEMLMKTGFEGIVWDLVSGRKKNAKVLKWGEDDYLRAFGLTKQEMRAWRESGAQYWLIGEYKSLKRKHLTESFDAIKRIDEEYYFSNEFFKICRKQNIKPSRGYRYLEKFYDANLGPHSRHKKSISTAWENWRDYLNMSAELGYDLTDETVLFPSDMYAKHDAVAKELTLKLEREKKERDAEERLSRKKRIEKWKEKYNFEINGYFIRVAENADEIILEGKTLKHCVGGYAERHMNGKTTILFLRRCETPEASLYTIEMQGNRLMQIHGYRNERDGAPSPGKVMKWLLEPWLDWIRRGSPRDEEGKPKIKIKKSKEKAA